MPPPYIGVIKLTGWVTHPMSDDGSCAGYYTVSDLKLERIQPQPIEALREQLSHRAILEAWHGPGFEYPDYADPNFDYETDDLGTNVTGVLLLDAFGQLAAEATVSHPPAEPPAVTWRLPQVLTPTERRALEARAKLLENEGAEEARWDNFESANRLREEAAALRRLLMLSERAQGFS